jgi:hypothetical protein
MPPTRRRTTKPVRKPEKKKAQPTSKADVLRPVTKKQATTTRPTNPASAATRATDRARAAQSGRSWEDDSRTGNPYPTTRQPPKPTVRDGRTYYPTTRTGPEYLDSYNILESSPDKPDYGYNSGWKDLPPTATTSNTTVTAGNPIPPLSTRRAPPQPQDKPAGLNHPASTGPIINPQGEVRARTANAFNYTDDARRNLAQSPISWGNATPEAGGNFYHPDSGRVELAPGNPETYHLPAAAHEMSHKRWFEDIQAENPAAMQDYMNDTNALVRAGNPTTRMAMAGWRNWHDENTDFFGQSADNVIPTEMHAGIAGDVRRPEDLPDWYRSKWYPRVWRDTDTRMGNQRNRFDSELPPGVSGPDNASTI